MQDVEMSTSSELTSLAADIQCYPVLSHAKHPLGNSHKLYPSIQGRISKFIIGVILSVNYLLLQSFYKQMRWHILPASCHCEYYIVNLKQKNIGPKSWFKEPKVCPYGCHKQKEMKNLHWEATQCLCSDCFLFSPIEYWEIDPAELSSMADKWSKTATTQWR